MKFEERKTMSRGKLASLLRKLADKLERGVLDYTRGEAAVPEQLDVEVEYKEKDREGKFELELRWTKVAVETAELSKIEPRAKAVETSKPVKAQTEVCEELPPHIDEVKEVLKKLFKEIQLGLEGGKMPESKDVSWMLDLNAEFNEFSADKGWHEKERAFTARLAEFETVVKKGDLAGAKRLIEELRVAKKECHRLYRWTER